MAAKVGARMMSRSLLLQSYLYLFAESALGQLAQPTQIIEVQLASLPDRIVAALPEAASKQLFDSSNQGVIFSGESGGRIEDNPFEDPDGSSIERLTKSCLTVQASSARPENLNVTFHLYTRRNPRVAFIIRPTASRLELLKSSPFDPKRKLTWITHGFRTNVEKSDWMVQAKDKVLAHEDANVILTDWRRGATPALSFYPKAAANAHIVAKMIVRLLQRLRYDLDFSQIHLIGHSLGAHIMGFVGSAFTEEYLKMQQQQLLSNNPTTSIPLPVTSSWVGESAPSFNVQLIGRITACDPALPCFGPSSNPPNAAGSPELRAQPGQSYVVPTGMSSSGNLYGTEYHLAEPDSIGELSTRWTHLRSDSALEVEVMHSNPGVMGYLDPLGDFDFYPNGYERQPGCGSSSKRTDESSGASGRSKRQAFLSSLPLVGGYFKQQSNIESTSPQKQQQNGVSNTINRFIKPIRDFFNAYTCSHHRSVEYMVASMYYDRTPHERRLDRDFVCQMVGYRCADYASFKRGFCFTCQNASLDCRSFTVFDSGSVTKQQQTQSTLAATGQQQQTKVFSLNRMIEKWKRSIRDDTGGKGILNDSLTSLSATQKRALPTPTRVFHLSDSPNYLAKPRTNYYFDTTKLTPNYCTHHYHLLIKYRWFRITEGLSISGLELTGTLTSVLHAEQTELTLHRYTHQSYTLLFTHPSFLGQIDSLELHGEKIKPMLIEYIQVTYMSNLDPKIRALGSARLCKQAEPNGGILRGTLGQFGRGEGGKTSYFARCSGSLMRDELKKE